MNHMAKIYGSLTELIGNTPLVELKNYGAKRQIGGKVIGCWNILIRWAV